MRRNFVSYTELIYGLAQSLSNDISTSLMKVNCITVSCAVNLLFVTSRANKIHIYGCLYIYILSLQIIHGSLQTLSR